MAELVLVPGAGGEAWYWHRVVPLLEAAGHRAVAVDLPGPDPEAGLTRYAELVAEAVAGRDGVVLVAQSMGGFTAPMVCGRADIRMLVLLNAMVPLPGETAGEWWRSTGSEQARLAAARAGGWPEELDPVAYFLHDLPADLARESGEHARDESAAAFEEPCRIERWPDVPTRVLVGREDRLFPAGFQQQVARDRLGVEADLLPGGHLCALSRPDDLVARLLTLVADPAG